MSGPFFVSYREPETADPTDFYPATGYRGSGSGGLGVVGTNGYTWGSAPYSTTSRGGARLDFDTSNENPEGSGNRSSGFPVRCVQE